MGSFPEASSTSSAPRRNKSSSTSQAPPSAAQCIAVRPVAGSWCCVGHPNSSNKDRVIMSAHPLPVGTLGGKLLRLLGEELGESSILNGHRSARLSTSKPWSLTSVNHLKRCKSSPALSRASTTECLPVAAAISTAPFPLLSLAVQSAFRRMRAKATSAWPADAASSKGVLPVSSRCSMSRPRSRASSTTSSWWLRTASCSMLSPPSPRT
mmetsp:Transcript_47787/g.126507  ORF Transcript_47787/g.126507 Transcript_47787/m.126507 type:complete len:210 (-) Transcript_47787:1189-1818(-)